MKIKKIPETLLFGNNLDEILNHHLKSERYYEFQSLL